MEENGTAPGPCEGKRSAAAPVDPEVVDKPSRRRFSPAYKLRILEEVDRCTEPGEVGRILRREGLYSSLVSRWRRQAEQGGLVSLAPKKRGPVAKLVDERDKRIVQLERELAKERRRSERAEALVGVQKKVAELLGIALPESNETK